MMVKAPGVKGPVAPGTKLMMRFAGVVPESCVIFSQAGPPATDACFGRC